MIKFKPRPDGAILRRIDDSATVSENIFTAAPVDEVIRMLSHLPEINGAGHRSLEIVSRLTPKDMTDVMRKLKVTNFGAAEIIKELGFRFPKDAKHHVRHTLICLASAIAASRARKLHQL